MSLPLAPRLRGGVVLGAEVLPDAWTTPVAAAILLAVTGWVWWRSPAWSDRPWHTVAPLGAGARQ